MRYQLVTDTSLTPAKLLSEWREAGIPLSPALWDLFIATATTYVPAFYISVYICVYVCMKKLHDLRARLCILSRSTERVEGRRDPFIPRTVGFVHGNRHHVRACVCARRCLFVCMHGRVCECVCVLALTLVCVRIRVSCLCLLSEWREGGIPLSPAL